MARVVVKVERSTNRIAVRMRAGQERGSDSQVIASAHILFRVDEVVRQLDNLLSEQRKFSP